MKEADLQTQCNKYLKRCNLLFYHKEKGGYNRRAGQKTHSAGLPDLIIWNKGRCIFIELKTESGKQTPGQIEWEAKSHRAGIPYYIARDFEEFIFAIHNEGIL